jgi:hypothetical protein
VILVSTTTIPAASIDEGLSRPSISVTTYK